VFVALPVIAENKQVMTLEANKPMVNMNGSGVTNDMDRVGQIYSDETVENVQNINKMVKNLRDPTRISESFRSALKRLAPKSTKGGEAGAVLAVPKLEMGAIIDGFGKKRTALIKLEDKTRMIREGHTFSVVKGNVVYEVYVEEIGLCEIKLTVSPPNTLIILR